MISRAALRALPSPRSIAVRLILALSLLVCLSTLVSLILHDSLSWDLEAAARARLNGSARAAERLIANYLADTLTRWQALSRTPEFRANLEVSDRATLQYFARQLRAAERADLVAFRDRNERALAFAGDPELASAVRDALATRIVEAPGNPNDVRACVGAPKERAGRRPARLELQPCARLIAQPFATLLGHDAGYVLARIPLSTRGRSVGALVVAARVPEDLLADWSEVIGATLMLATSEQLQHGLAAEVLSAAGVVAYVQTSNRAEREALATSRRRMLAAGLLTLGLGFLVAMWLGSTLARPIQELRDATVRAGSGDLDVRVDATRRDELGDVARAFNATLENLRHSRDRLLHLAYSDPLTEVGNRRSLQEELERRLAAPPGPSALSLMIVDLSRFKAVNDTLGNLAGDEVLKGAAARIEAAVAEFATGAPIGPWRLGGNEFAVLLPSGDAEEAARRIVTLFAQPFDSGGQEIRVGARIGIAPDIAGCESPSAALRSCDLALRQAKRSASEPCVVYEPSMDEPVLRRHVMEQRLRATVERDGLRVVYQPRVTAVGSHIVGFEALVRWTDPVLGVVPPAEFVRLAEDARIVVALGERVLRRALAQIAAWRTSGAPSAPRVSVNVSQIQLSPDFVELVGSTLEQLSLPADCLELEITETALMEDEGTAREALAQLRASGVRIALDDFGSGHSSLGMLRRLPITVLKMDRVFVRGLGEDADAEAVAAAIIALGRVYGLEVVAEGVETPAQRDLLASLGCDELQGFLFSPPLDADDAARALARGTLGEQKPAARTEPA